MELINALIKYHKIVKEEENFNYKYNPLLTSKFNNKRKIAAFLGGDKQKKNLCTINSFNNQGTILEEKFFLEQINKRKRIIKGNRDKIK